MHRIAYYHSLALAHIHAAALRDRGIMAGVVGDRLTGISPMSAYNMGRGDYELVISTKRAHDAALAILQELRDEPPTDPQSWEHQTVPDLTRLDPALVPPCARCGAPLDPARPDNPCRSCRTPNDLIERIVELHGPEALEPCFSDPDPLSDITDEELATIEIDCPHCDYPLDGLGASGSCPECGTAFNRRALFRDILDPDHEQDT